MNIDDSVHQKWKSMLDLISGITGNSAAFVIQLEENELVFLLNSFEALNSKDIAQRLMPVAAEYSKAVLSTKQSLIVNNSLKTAEWIYLHSEPTAYMGYPISYPSGQVFGVICVIDNKERKFCNWSQQLIEQYASIMQDDIAAQTDREHAKKDQAKMQESEARYHSLFHLNNAVQIITDCETGSICEMNDAARHYYGMTGNETKKLWDIDLSGEKALRKRLKTVSEKNSGRFSSEHMRYDGQQRDVEIFGGCVQISDRKLFHMIVQDITDRKRTERGLIESENRFRIFVENAPDGVFVVMDGLFVYMNRMAIKLFGVAHESDLLGNSVNSFFPDLKQMSLYWSRLAKKPRSMDKTTLHRANQQLVEVELSAAPFQLGGEAGALVFIHDISVRKQLEAEKLNMEAQLRHKQKLESIGVLAGGVAHEINNPVSGIINYAQLIAETPGASEDIVEFSSEIVKEGQRIAGIVKNLLKFARQEKQTHSLAQVNDIINETLLLIRTILRTDRITLDVTLTQDLPSVKCRSQQIQQVLMNLITNARDALNTRYKNEDEEKRILLSSEVYMRMDGSEWVRIIVKDHGVGIPDDVKEKMFDPFFTTKSRNEGTGLGLSISHGIVQDHHGCLYFESKLNAYTRAILELPVNNGWNLASGLKG